MPKKTLQPAGSDPCTSDCNSTTPSHRLNGNLRSRKKHRSSTSSDELGNTENNEEKSKRRGGRSNTNSTSRSERDGPLEEFKEMVCAKVRVIVSQNRRRIKTDGFDLDLTYITDRIIAMGYPANATEALYRNSMKHTIRFLEKRHKDHYKVFNLRGQYSYDPANFKNRVVSFEMTDHHPPRLELMAPFCREVHEWLCEDARNVVAVHCKAGKGRTGVMICAYLSYCLFYPSPRQNMDYYSVVRTRNNKGVTIPSQRRYVYYYDHLRKHKLNYLPCRMQLVGIYIERPPKSRGPLMRDQLSMRVANGDIDVYYGQPMNISDEVWLEEESAWAGHIISVGPDSYDPNDPVEGCDVISRRAYGWTVPTTQPVFLEGDVRVDLYVHKKFINIFTSTGRNKLGHIWFNTMFSCPGACGGDAYVHGDEAHPYPEGETTIAARKKQFTIGVDDAASSNNDEFEKKDVEESVPTPLSLTCMQSKSSPLLSPERSPSASVGAMSSPSMSSANFTPKSKERKSSRLSKAGKAAKKFFASSEGAKRSSEPSMCHDSTAVHHRSSNPESLSCGGPLRFNFDELQIAEPPGLERHCPPESLQKIYIDKGKIPPRSSIKKMLTEAHQKELVQDIYNERRRSVPSEGDPVTCGPTGRPDASGPNRLVRNYDEHVSVFPIMEVDRACKNESIPTGFKLIVVTKCVDAKMSRHADAFMNVTYEKQKKVNDDVYWKSQRGKAYVDSEPKLSEFGAGKTWPPVIQYGNVGMQGSGGEAATLSDYAYKDDPRARDDRYCRFFYKQRRDSISEYPSANHICPLLVGNESSMRSERLGTGTTVISDATKVPDRSTTPVDLEVDELAAMVTTGTFDGEKLMDEMDIDVRSYHPDPATAWDHSGSSRSSSSSDDVQMQPNSSIMTTDYSGVDSSINNDSSAVQVESDRKLSEQSTSTNLE